MTETELSGSEKALVNQIRRRIAGELGRPLSFADQWRVDIELQKHGIRMHNEEAMKDNQFYRVAQSRRISHLFHRNAARRDRSGD